MLAMQFDFDLILSKVATLTITRKYNFTISRLDSMKYVFVAKLMYRLSNSSKSTAMTIASIDKKLQDLGDCVAATNMDNCSNADSGKLASAAFVEYWYVITHSVNYDCGINECHLNIEQHLTLLLRKILKYTHVNERNGKFFGNVITLNNEQYLNGFGMLKFSMKKVIIKIIIKIIIFLKYQMFVLLILVLMWKMMIYF